MLADTAPQEPALAAPALSIAYPFDATSSMYRNHHRR
jgi:hypothetical protein